jgi:hypothetical protein
MFDPPCLLLRHQTVSPSLTAIQALRKARESSNGISYQSIFHATRGIIFLGTPHHGSSYASFGKHVARVVKFIRRDTNVSLLRSIEQDSEILERISEDFRTILTRRRLKVCSFVEELSMSSLLSVSAVMLCLSSTVGRNSAIVILTEA